MQFKTNIKCSGCIAKVTPFLDETIGKGEWQVDTNDPDKILTIADKKELSPDEVVSQVAAAGFKASIVDSRLSVE